MRRRARARLALAVALSMVELGCRSSPEEPDRPPPPTPVRCEPVTERTVEVQARLRGTVAAPPNQDAIVSSAVAGRIVSLKVLEGDAVAKGDLLAVVENPSLGSDQEQAAASVASARAILENAQKTLGRERELFDQGIAARRAVEDAEARVASATADLSVARAQQRLAAQQSARAKLGAPLAGTVVRVTRGLGELVDGTPATPILEVANTSVLELSCDVASSELVRIDEGAAARVELDALPDQSIDGKVVSIAPTVDQTTSLGRIRLELSPPAALSKRLHLGMAGQAILTTAQRRALVVPPPALSRSQDGRDQLVVCKEEKGGTVAQVTEVTVGTRDQAWVEITKGPAPGTLVVVDRALGLEDGTRLAPRKRSP